MVDVDNLEIVTAGKMLVADRTHALNRARRSRRHARHVQLEEVALRCRLLRLLEALGDSAPDPEVQDAVQQELSARPGLEVEVAATRVVYETDEERVEERTYRVTEPGQAPRLVTCEVSWERTGGEWTEASMIPISEGPE